MFSSLDLGQTESVHIKVPDDIDVNSDSEFQPKCAVLNTPDLNILLNRCGKWVGISGSALRCFKSCITGTVSIANYESECIKIICGVPQGSILYLTSTWFLQLTSWNIIMSPILIIQMTHSSIYQLMTSAPYIC